ncbi:MAG: Nramp family divalent metal transporter, partial [Leifsonia flava]
MGPALVAGVAYLDPGNVASNMTAGARYGYLLVWVVVLANGMAWLIQYLSAKLGIVTGESLPQVLGRRIRR